MVWPSVVRNCGSFQARTSSKFDMLLSFSSSFDYYAECLKSLHEFLLSPGRLRQKVLHHPNFALGPTRGKSDVVTARIKTKAADRIHSQPQGVRFSATRRDREELCFRLLAGGPALAEDDVARIGRPIQRVSHDRLRLLRP